MAVIAEFRGTEQIPYDEFAQDMNGRCVVWIWLADGYNFPLIDDSELPVRMIIEQQVARFRGRVRHASYVTADA